MDRAMALPAVVCMLAATMIAALGVAAHAQEPDGEERPELAGRWVRIPNAPWGSVIPVVVAVDGAMLVVDRKTGRVQTYDPDTRRWERGTRAPWRLTGNGNGPWVWTGEELIVLDRHRADRNQAYDPRTNAWRSLAASPLKGHDLAVSAGGQIMVAHFGDGDERDHGMAMYDLVTDSWTAIEAVPAVGRVDWGSASLDSLHWTGSEVLAVTSGEAVISGEVEEGEPVGPVQVTAYDRAAGAWGEPVDGPLLGSAPAAIWAGDRLVFASEEPRRDLVIEATYDPVSMTWEARDYDCPLDSYRAIFTGEFLLGRSHALEPSSGDCYRLPRPSFSRSRIGQPELWLVDRAMYWTQGRQISRDEFGCPEECVPYKRDGAAFIVAKVGIAEAG